MDITDSLRDLGHAQYAAGFIENSARTDLLPTLTANDLKDLGVC